MQKERAVVQYLPTMCAVLHQATKAFTFKSSGYTFLDTRQPFRSDDNCLILVNVEY
jgi:hypothetical protein